MVRWNIESILYAFGFASFLEVFWQKIIMRFRVYDDEGLNSSIPFPQNYSCRFPSFFFMSSDFFLEFFNTFITF